MYTHRKELDIQYLKEVDVELNNSSEVLQILNLLTLPNISI